MKIKKIHFIQMIKSYDTQYSEESDLKIVVEVEIHYYKYNKIAKGFYDCLN